jgi:rhamnogalacturonan acetylesterase
MLRCSSHFLLSLMLVLLALILPSGAQKPAVGPPVPAPLGPAEPLVLSSRKAHLPTLWIVGDSTAAAGGANATGWGMPLSKMLDAKAVNVVNGARGGRSSRTFVTEGLWARVAAEAKAGDWVLIQFGHNDAGPVNDRSRARGSLRSGGEETEEIHNLLTNKPETVHSFGWYVRKMIAETRAKGAHPVVLGLTVRNEWLEGRVERRNGPWNELARKAAEATGTPFVDLTERIAMEYEKLGPEKVKPFFPKDHTHTGPEGAAFTARLMVGALRELGLPGMPPG